MTILSSIFNNEYFQIFFAAWTGFYIWQIITGEEGKQFTLFAWMGFGFLAAMLIVGSTVTEG